MIGLTAHDHNRAQEAFINGMVPGGLVCSASILLYWVVSPAPIGLRVLIALMCVGGLIASLTMGFSARRREIDAARRQPTIHMR